MSKEKNHKSSDIKSHEKHEPAKRAPERKPQPVQAAPKRRGFLASVFSHLAVAAIAVIGVGSYIHWNDILNYTGSRVCAYNVLGQYAKGPVKVPPIDLKKAPETATDKSSEKPVEKAEKSAETKPEAKAQSKSDAMAPAADATTSTPKVQSEASITPKNEAGSVEKSQTKALEQQPKAQSFADALQAARKLFWQNDKAAVKAYEVLVQKQPKNGDLRAEMANVYYKNGFKDKAEETFFEAGKTFLADKNLKKAKSIAEILKRISPDKSAEFSKLLNAEAN